jgi:hypothetical protein
MKRLFNKSNQQSVTSYRDEPTYSPAGQSSQYATFEDRDENSRSSPLNRSSAVTPRSRTARKDVSAPREADRRAPTGGSGKSYPSYGEIYQDPSDNRGVLAASLAASRGPQTPMNDRTSHQKLPPRTMGDQPYRTKSSSNSQSNWDAAQQDGQRERPYSGGMGAPESSQSFQSNANSGHENDPWRQSKNLKSNGGMINRSQSVNRGGSMYGEAVVKKPSRRPSLIYGIDSGLHGGQAAVATANANEEDLRGANMATRRYSPEQDVNVIRPESRYIDRIPEVRTLQSAAIGAGMDRMKRKFFGRKKREEKEEEEAKSSEEWVRSDRPTSMEVQQVSRPVAITETPERRETEQPHAHTPWLKNLKASKATDGTISSQIGMFCFHEEETWDWKEVMALCDTISHSEAASKEAARALRKEFKLGEEESKLRAICLWAIICINSSDRFRLQVASKKFLEALEDLYTDKKGTTRIRGRLLVVWSMLANAYQTDQELSPITKMFNKIKPNEMPVNGIPLDPSHDLFNPTGFAEQQEKKSVVAPSSQDIYHDHHAVHQELTSSTRSANSERLQPFQTQTTTVVQSDLATKSSPRLVLPPLQRADESLQEMPRISDDIRRLHEECQVARSNAQLLLDSLIEHGLESELVKEFADKTQLSQDFILAQIPWASAQVDSSRLEAQDRAANGGDAASEGMSTEAELLMNDLLGTHEKLLAATGMVDEARNRHREEEEERQAIERSMRDQRVDRSAFLQDPSTGHLYSGGLSLPSDNGQGSSSRSGTPSPIPPPRRPLPIPGHDSTAMEKSLSTSSANVPPLQLSSLDGSRLDHLRMTTSVSQGGLSTMASRGGGPRPMNGSDHSQAARPDLENREEDDETEDSVIMTPIVPSEKALGKRRAMSIRESSSPTPASTTKKFDISHQVSALSMEASPLMEATLRARPPPALPTEPSTITPRINPSTTLFYRPPRPE